MAGFCALVRGVAADLKRFCLLALLLAIEPAVAQELVPRAYWPAPDGTNLLIVSYQHTSGDVVTDPTLPLTGVDSRASTGSLAYQRTFSLFDRTANFQFALPYVDSRTSGIVEGEFRERDFSAFADARLQLSINLKGAPSMGREDFRAWLAKPETIIGASIVLVPPTGGYDEDRVINAGTNRWAAKAGLGVIWPIYPTWLFDVGLGAWFFGDNDEFVGRTRQQDPITSLEFHLIKQFRPDFWASIDANYYYGGETVVGDQVRRDLQRNSRLGGTIVIPFKGRHAFRFAYSTGVVTESGGDYDMITVNYAVAW